MRPAFFQISFEGGGHSKYKVISFGLLLCARAGGSMWLWTSHTAQFHQLASAQKALSSHGRGNETCFFTRSVTWHHRSKLPQLFSRFF